MKVSPKPNPNTGNLTITMNTKASKAAKAGKPSKWWEAKSDKELADQLTATITFLRENQNERQRAAALYARLYGNSSLFNFVGSSVARSINTTNNLPTDRPTFNIIQSATDTLISRIGQSRPTPIFLTDGADYKERNLAKKLNNFILGEFYQTKAYEKAAIILRDALVEGTGCLKVYEDNKKVALERVLLTELFVDPVESIYGDPRRLYQIKLVDRQVLIDKAPKYKAEIERAERASTGNSVDASKSAADLVLVVEAWSLPSGKDAKDGRHTIACSGGIILDEEYTKDKFPFVFLHYSTRLLGFWSQGLAEQLMGTQVEINSLLVQISKAIKMVGVPRVFVEKGSKIVKAHFTNEVGGIIEYSGVKPTYEVAQCVPQELYAQLQRLIDYGYQQCGVSALQASSQKPAGLNSGEAIRSYDDISTDRFNSLSRKYDNLFIDLAYLIVDLAKDIAEEEGSYETVYPGKDGTKSINLPKISLIKNPYIIQCYNMSSLPRDPAGRMQKVTEMIQAGMIDIKEGRRLLDYPDLQQNEKLANAAEERILQILDKIIEGPEGYEPNINDEDQKPKSEITQEDCYTPPDPFMDLALAEKLVTQYINLYSQYNLEEEKMQQLRDFFTQIQGLKAAATTPQPPIAGEGQPAPQAMPEPLPTSPLVPNAVGTAA